MVDNPSEIRLSLDAGAAGYLLKEAAADEVVEAIRRVARGEQYLQPSLGAALTRLRPPLGRARIGSVETITVRERDVLRLLAPGHTNAEAGRSLGVALRTIEAHRSHIVQKLGLRTRAELVRYCDRQRLVDIETLLFPAESRPATLLLVLAGATMVIGVLGALAQDDVKRILSFTIVSQIGYLAFGLALFTVPGVAASTRSSPSACS
jgi:DNA-binding CsgD family transcriptional regulator